MEFEELVEYKKDIKQYLKKYKTINEDIDIIKKVLQVNAEERPPFSYRIDNLKLKTCIIKIKKIASKSFKGKGINSGFRLIYAHFPIENKIVFIEIYHKNEKAIEDKNRIISNFE